MLNLTFFFFYPFVRIKGRCCFQNVYGWNFFFYVKQLFRVDAFLLDHRRISRAGLGAWWRKRELVRVGVGQENTYTKCTHTHACIVEMHRNNRGTADEPSTLSVALHHHQNRPLRLKNATSTFITTLLEELSSVLSSVSTLANIKGSIVA